jgi:hypothetical protein
MFRLSMLVLIFILTGCATTQFGNFVAHNDEAHNKSIASDVTGQLIQLYPPASTQFNMQHPTVDSFGDALVGAFKQTTPKSHRIFFNTTADVALNQIRASQF